MGRGVKVQGADIPPPDTPPDELPGTARSGGSSGGSEIVLTRASDVRPERVAWAWAGRVPSGMFTLLVGKPKIGKSTIACYVVAGLTAGTLDGDMRGQPVNALFLSAEDSPTYTLVPRLVAARADLTRVHFLALKRDGVTGGIELPDDAAELFAAVERVDARLVVVDPVTAHLGGRVDSHRDAPMRRAVAPLHRLADERGVTVLGLAHTNKAQGGDVFARTGGSVAMTAAPRSLLLAGAAPDGNEDEALVLVHVASNVSVEAPTLRYRLASTTIELEDRTPIGTSAVEWLGEAPEVSQYDVLADRSDDEDEERSARVTAVDWLRDVLAGGPVSAKDVRRLAREDGIADRTLDRAKRKAGVRSERVGGLGAEGRWMWSLPDDPNDANDALSTSTPGGGRDSDVRGSGGVVSGPVRGRPRRGPPPPITSTNGHRPPTDADLRALTTADTAEPCAGCGRPALLRLPDGRPHHKNCDAAGGA